MPRLFQEISADMLPHLPLHKLPRSCELRGMGAGIVSRVLERVVAGPPRDVEMWRSH